MTNLREPIKEIACDEASVRRMAELIKAQKELIDIMNIYSNGIDNNYDFVICKQLQFKIKDLDANKGVIRKPTTMRGFFALRNFEEILKCPTLDFVLK